MTRDPNDDYLVHLYRYAGADVLCTGDADLRDADLPDVRVLTPAELVTTLGCREDGTR
ncbi:MAG TPA: hypothetical protein VKP11_12380 [Frankiaceae bacterium]|nr:hypothetical protein [Frankiaceae bacterium]